MIKRENLIALVCTRMLNGLDILSLDDKRLSNVLIDRQTEQWSILESNDFHAIGRRGVIDKEHNFSVVAIYDKTKNDHLKSMATTILTIAEVSDDYYRGTLSGLGSISFC